MSSCYSGSTSVNDKDMIPQYKFVDGCELLIMKSFDSSGEAGYGYMSAVKVDCDCKFTK